MMKTITLTSANMKQFVPLYCTVFNAPPWHDGWSESVAHERLQGFAAFPTFLGLGLLQDARPVGLVLGWGEHWVNGWVFHLKEMCIDPSMQRHGLGNFLMDALELRLRELDFSSINLQTGRLAPAARFYEKRGFVDLNLVSLDKRL